MIIEGMTDEYNTANRFDKISQPIMLKNELEPKQGEVENKEVDIKKAIQDIIDNESKRIEENNNTAFSRLIADIQRSGINPNLVNLSASPYYEPTKKDFSMLQDYMQQAFDEKENNKDRIAKLVVALIAMTGMILRGSLK